MTGRPSCQRRFFEDCEVGDEYRHPLGRMLDRKATSGPRFRGREREDVRRAAVRHIPAGAYEVLSVGTPVRRD